MTPIDVVAVLALFSGKPLEKAREALNLLICSMEQGFWVTGVSRSVRAVMGKSNVVQKAIPKGESVWSKWDSPLANLHMAVMYGPQYLKRMDMEYMNLARKAAQEMGVEDAFAAVEKWVQVMLPVVQAMDFLDATRPPPVLTLLGVSPSVNKTLDAINRGRERLAGGSDKDALSELAD